MSKLTFAGLDPAMNNTGIAIGTIDLATADWKIDALKLVKPPKLEKDMRKVIRKSSDDLARARYMRQELSEFLTLHNVQMVFSEIPSGGQSARAAFGFGTAVMLVASLEQVVVELTPKEVKLATGDPYAAKESIIKWATERWPDLPWLRKKFKGALRLIDDNEHIADACAVACAGLKTEEFKRAFVMARAHTLKAA